MNKSIAVRIFALAGCALIASCNLATPENYFERAVLNCNLMHGFAGPGLRRGLESPSVKLKAGTKDETIPMTRKDVIENKLTALEANLEKVQKLKKTDDTRDMVEASLALYEYVLPVYRGEYQQLARLYDEGAPAAQIATLAQSIEQRYRPGYVTRFDRLIALAKPFAERHQIKVKWDVSTEPSP